MPRYRVAICFEEGVAIEVDADNEADAEAKAELVAEEYAGSKYPSEYNHNRVHRMYFTQDAEEITNG